MFFYLALVLCTFFIAANAAPGPTLFSWDTLPVFVHSANASGPWSEAAVKQLSRFAMVTNEKNHGMRLPNGSSQSEEIAGPYACTQIRGQGTGSDSFFYLNSIIDWTTNYNLHQLMVDNPSWRMKNYSSGADIGTVGTNWGYNHSVPEMRAAWVNECVQAVKNGCTGCFIDQANFNEVPATWPRDSPSAIDYNKSHLAALEELAAVRV